MGKDVDSYINLVNAYVNKVNEISAEEQEDFLNKPIEDFVSIYSLVEIKKLNINTFGELLASYEKCERFPYAILRDVVECARNLGWKGKTLIVEMELTVSVCSILNRAGIYYLDQIIEMTHEELFDIPHLGRKNYESIVREISERGFLLA